MANNRLYIRCKSCGKVVYIGKHFADALKAPADIHDKLNEFFFDHNYCGNMHYSLELCEEFPGEMTDNNIDSNGIVCWYNRNGYK